MTDPAWMTALGQGQIDKDRRLTPARADRAASFLKGRIDAPLYVDGVVHQVVAGAAELREAPSRTSRLETQLLKGERFIVYAVDGDWTWGQAEADLYVGHVHAGDLRTELFAPTHRVTATQTLIFPAPDIKSSPHASLPLNAKLAVSRVEGKFVALADGGFVFAGHVAPLAATHADWPETALGFLGAPYLWGGKTAAGVDCSGLVQTALDYAGLAAPRDSDLQEALLGRNLPIDEDFSDLQRGDLVFWDGHVGLMLDADTLLHANAHHMAVEAESLRDAAARIEAASGGSVTSIKRL